MSASRSPHSSDAVSLPNFFVIGVAKGGTTSLYEYARQHPDIYMSPNKEPLFFALQGDRPRFRGPGDETGVNRHAVTDRASYEALFAAVRNEIAIGEASPLYLIHPKAPERIQAHDPDAKIIAILRDPADRAYADYSYQRQRGSDPALTFIDAILAEEERVADRWSYTYRYLEKGFYHRHLSKFWDLFPKENVQIHLYEDLRNDADGLMRDIFRFLDVDESVPIDTGGRYSASGTPRNQVLQAMLNRARRSAALRRVVPRSVLKASHTALQRNNLRRPSPLGADARAFMIERYEEDIRLLEKALGRDLSRWLAV